MAANSVTNRVSVEATATTASANATINIKKILWLVNDGSVNLIVNFDNSGLTGGTAGAFTLKPGEFIKDWDVEVGKIYYKSASATAAFRLLGIPNSSNSGY